MRRVAPAVGRKMGNAAMKCRSEKILEKAASKLLALGIDLRVLPTQRPGDGPAPGGQAGDGQAGGRQASDGRAESELALGAQARRDEEGERFPALGPKLREVLEHSRECVRCRELLALFQAAMTGLEEELAEGEQVADGILPASGSRTIELRPVRSMRLSPSEDADEPPSFRVAADSGPEGDKGEIAAEAPVLTLESKDGRYLVRIFAREPGPGAVAVLLQSEGLGDTLQVGNKSQSLVLQVGDEQFAIGEDGYASLPRFPAETIVLLVQ